MLLIHIPQFEKQGTKEVYIRVTVESLIPREAAKCQGLKSQEGLENQGK